MGGNKNTTEVRVGSHLVRCARETYLEFEVNVFKFLKLNKMYYYIKKEYVAPHTGMNQRMVYPSALLTLVPMFTRIPSAQTVPE